MVAASTSSVQRCLVTRARKWQGSKDADLKEVHSLLHPSASRPEGPTAAVVCSAADLIHGSIQRFKQNGMYVHHGGYCWWLLQGVHIDQEGVYRQGCPSPLSLHYTSVNEVSRWRTPLLLCSPRRRRAVFVFPWNMRFANEWASCSLFIDDEVLGMHCCIVLTFLKSSFRFPSSYVFNRLYRHVMWSLAFNLQAGFWSRRMGMTCIL